MAYWYYYSLVNLSLDSKPLYKLEEKVVLLYKSIWDVHDHIFLMVNLLTLNGITECKLGSILMIDGKKKKL